MTPQERELLGAFLQQMTQAQAGQKDAEAEALIREAAARQPDAVYLLVQRAMGLDYALQASQAEVAKLKAALDQSRPEQTSSFFNDPNAWGRAAPGPASMAPRASNQTLPPLAPATLSQAAAPVRAAAASSWGGAGILGTVATTAAGVVAGSFLFQGIQGMMGHHNQTADAGAHTASPPPEPNQLAANSVVADDASYHSADFTDTFDGDFDSGDSV